MKPGGGKQKGASFERKICKRLSKWISNGEREDIFWRSAMSGGRATVGLKGGKQFSSQAGDISAVHQLGNEFIDTFTVECKHVANLQIPALLFERKGNLAKFWNKLLFESQAHNKKAMLIAKQNRLPILWICEEYLVNVDSLFILEDSIDSMVFYNFNNVLEKAIPEDVIESVK